MTKKVEFIYTQSFEKDIKKLNKKYPSLLDDIQILKIQLSSEPECHIKIEWIGNEFEGKFFKIKKFRCKSLTGNSVKSGIRIIYRYIEETGELEFCEIEFVEIYHKNTQTDFDRNRLEKYRKE